MSKIEEVINDLILLSESKNNLNGFVFKYFHKYLTNNEILNKIFINILEDDNISYDKKINLLNYIDNNFLINFYVVAKINITKEYLETKDADFCLFIMNNFIINKYERIRIVGISYNEIEKIILNLKIGSNVLESKKRVRL